MAGPRASEALAPKPCMIRAPIIDPKDVHTAFQMPFIISIDSTRRSLSIDAQGTYMR